MILKTLFMQPGSRTAIIAAGILTPELTITYPGNADVSSSDTSRMPNVTIKPPANYAQGRMGVLFPSWFAAQTARRALATGRPWVWAKTETGAYPLLGTNDPELGPAVVTGSMTVELLAEHLPLAMLRFEYAEVAL